MAAVAGAVADEILQAMVYARDLPKAYVNNGGDIALHLASGKSLTLGVVNDADHPAIDARLTLSAALPVRGLATSGWRGRSQSLGIADAVKADAAATLIANAVNVAHPAIGRARACELRADSDLGDLPVTVQVGILPAPARAEALHQGCALARRLQRQGLIHAAYLALQGEIATVLPPGMPAEPAVCRSVAAKKS